MREDFLHYIWLSGDFDVEALQTTQGKSLTILQRGLHNTFAGPDFKEALLQIGANQWAGSVEIHINASDWLKHRHDNDPLYDNVILHVVWEEDALIQRSDGSPIPCLTLKHRVATRTLNTYRKMMWAQDWVPCAFGLKDLPVLPVRAWLDRLMLQRLEHKSTDIQLLKEEFEGDIEQVLFILLCRNFGFGVNHSAFEAIAKHLKYLIVLKHKNDLRDIESLLFGMAGLLEYTPQPDTYTLDLYRRFSHWKKKYGLIPRNKKALHSFKLRPANFPTIRLAQLAYCLYQSTHLVSQILQYTHEQEFRQMFALSVSEYWQEHYHLGKRSKRRISGRLSRTTLHLLLINTVAPFLYFYGLDSGQPSYVDRALDLLQNLPAERNHIISKWKHHGIAAASALDSQALIFLKKQYCDHRRCMDCALGQTLVKTHHVEVE